jgi:hypothetical protein
LKPKTANRWLYVTAFVGTALFGGSLFAMTLYTSASASPHLILLFIRPPFKGGFTFFVIFNSLMEWLLLPGALFLNWRIPARRNLLIVGALLYYSSRCWTYVYFVPAIFRFMSVPADNPLSPDLASQIMRWVNLSWIRCAVDGVLACVLLYATSKPNAPNVA